LARFQQRITDEDVAAARRKIAAGASLRSAAAEIPCAPSTLSVRLRKSEAAELKVDAGSISGENDEPAARFDRAGTRTLPPDIEPVDVLHEALSATKANGHPDWTTRLAAVRALTALRPGEIDTKGEEQPTEPSIVVFDLPPGALPVLHRARKADEAPASPGDAEAVQLPTSSGSHMFSYEPADGESVVIGTWFPAQIGDSTEVVSLAFHNTDDREEADRWTAELSAGRLPESRENVT
jgi:hypothetical protein